MNYFKSNVLRISLTKSIYLIFILHHSNVILITDEEEYIEGKINYSPCIEQCEIKSTLPLANTPTSKNEGHREISHRLLKYSWDIREDEKHKKDKYNKVS